MRRRATLFASALLLGTAMPAIAAAQDARVTADLNMRAGPSTRYPVVTTIPEDNGVNIYGCTDGYEWCDVRWQGRRGWVFADYLDYRYDGRYVPVQRYGARVDLPILSFTFGNYWDDHYRDEPWYRDRSRWRDRRDGRHDRDRRHSDRDRWDNDRDGDRYGRNDDGDRDRDRYRRGRDDDDRDRRRLGRGDDDRDRDRSSRSDRVERNTGDDDATDRNRRNRADDGRSDRAERNSGNDDDDSRRRRNARDESTSGQQSLRLEGATNLLEGS